VFSKAASGRLLFLCFGACNLWGCRDMMLAQVAALEAALASERALSAKLQGQLASEIEHAAEAARHQADSESTASKALESARKVGDGPAL
jgi:type II secretory pathway component PulM